MIIPGKDFIPIVENAFSRNQSIRMAAHGDSMTPFIYNGDIVEIKPLGQRVQFGDIVLARSGEGEFIIHRVVKNNKSGVKLRGDGLSFFAFDGPLPESDIIGLVVRSWHNGNLRAHDQGVWKVMGLLWSVTCPFGIILYRLLRFLFSASGIRSCLRLKAKTLQNGARHKR